MQAREAPQSTDSFTSQPHLDTLSPSRDIFVVVATPELMPTEGILPSGTRSHFWARGCRGGGQLLLKNDSYVSE